MLVKAVKKAVPVLAMVFTVATNAVATNVFFPTEVGMELTTANYKNIKKKKPKNFSRMTISEVTGEADSMVVTYAFEGLNKKGVSDGTPLKFSVRIINNVVEINPIGFLPEELFTGTSGFVLTGTKVRIPATLAVGDRLEDVRMLMLMQLPSGMSEDDDIASEDVPATILSTEFLVNNQRCVSAGPLTVPAGTYESFKVSSDFTVIMKFGFRFTHRGSITTWYAPNIGTVQTVTHNHKGKTKGVSRLYSVKRT
jgi:hypothetical protein